MHFKFASVFTKVDIKSFAEGMKSSYILHIKCSKIKPYLHTETVHAYSSGRQICFISIT